MKIGDDKTTTTTAQHIPVAQTTAHRLRTLQKNAHTILTKYKDNNSVLESVIQRAENMYRELVESATSSNGLLIFPVYLLGTQGSEQNHCVVKPSR